MRNVIITFFLICSYSLYGQNDSCILIRNSKHKITLFQSNYFFKHIQDNDGLRCYEIPYGKYADSKPWTPTNNQILDFEYSLKDLIKQYKDSIDSRQIEDIKFIIRNLDKYNRQYYCCLNKIGERILEIQFSIQHKDDNLNEPDTDLFTIFGGGANYFDLTYNLDLRKIVRFSINAPM